MWRFSRQAAGLPLSPIRTLEYNTLYMIDADGRNYSASARGEFSDLVAGSEYPGFEVIDPSGDPYSDIYIVNADGSNLHSIELSRQGAWGWRWSPDGQHLVLVHAFTVERHDLYLADPDGTNPHRLLKSEVSEYALSPDSRHLAVVAIGGNVYVTDLTGQKLNQLCG